MKRANKRNSSVVEKEKIGTGSIIATEIDNIDELQSDSDPTSRQRSLTLAERNGLLKALEVVKSKSREIKAQGMSPISFTLGLLNVAFTAFILGRFPQHYWLWQACISSPLLIWYW
jgi:hypothetical protein